MINCDNNNDIAVSIDYKHFNHKVVQMSERSVTNKE